MQPNWAILDGNTVIATLQTPPDEDPVVCSGGRQGWTEVASYLEEGWTKNADGTFSPPPVPPAPVPDRCSKLGLKRALAETGPDAVFPKPEWQAVKDLIAKDDDLQEDWDLATVIVRSEPLVQTMIVARKYDDATVDKILVRANALAG